MSENRSALIVDDERDIRELLTLTLGRMGLRIDTAANLGEAREHLSRNTYDLCFTDMNLPDGNGTLMIEALSQHSPATVSVVASIYDDDLHLMPALRAGHDAQALGLGSVAGSKHAPDTWRIDRDRLLHEHMRAGIDGGFEMNGTEIW